MTQVFLNYRSDDEPYGVAMLERALVERFGSAAVFVPSESIPLGADWERLMFRAIAASAVLLAIMGRGWLSRDELGRRKIDDPTDFVRREILHALSLGKRVIPVRLDTPRLPRAELPQELAPLAGCQDIEIRFDSHAADVDRLATALAEQIPELSPAATGEDVPAGSDSNTVTFRRAVRVKGDLVGRDQHNGTGSTGKRGRS